MTTSKKFWLILTAIIFLAAALRLRGFDHRFLFSGDVGRDLLVARGAVILGELPWVGNFSSAGPFVFGPIYYWFLMLCLILFPNVFLAPWLVLFSISLFFIVVMALAGRAAGGRRLGLIIALLTATSPLIIGYSFYLQQHELVLIFAGIALLGLIAYLRKQNPAFAFLAGLGIGGGISMHYQGLNLLVFVPAFYVAGRPSLRKWLKISLVLGLGIIIPYLPLLIWDGSRHFKNLEQIFYFFRVGQYRFYVGNRWLTYLGSFWPGFIGKMVGGTFWFGVFSLVGSFAVLGITFLRKKLPLTILLPICVWVVQLAMLRYYRGERFDGYLIYFQPLVLFITGVAMYYLVRQSRNLGFLIIMATLVSNIYFSNQYWSYQNDAFKLKKIAEEIRNYYGGQKVAVFGRGLSTSNSVFPMSYVLLTSNLEDDQGIPVGVCRFSIEACGIAGIKEITRTIFQGEPMTVVDLSAVPSGELTKQNDWYRFSVLATYDDVQNWWRKGL